MEDKEGDQRPRNQVLTLLAVGSGQKMKERREGRGVTTDIGGICITLMENWGCNKAGTNVSEYMRDTAGREVVIGCVYDLREGEHGGIAMGNKGPGWSESEQETARTRI